MADADLPVEKLGSYRLLRKLGAGGMGEVYLAENTVTGVPAAIKILTRTSAASPAARERFIREATEASTADHPAIVRALTAGDENGVYYYVMDYCEGTSLARKLETAGHLPLAEATELVIQIAEALGYAHGKGIIHRDIKPSNILLTPQGKARILDLGLVKNLTGTPDGKLTAAGDSMGTPHYMSPEQARGDATIDGRADLYSLGATWFHLVTGTIPFPGSSPFETISKHLTEAAPDPRDLRPDLPDRTAAAIRRLMAKKPDDRFQSAADLVAALREDAPASPPAARPPAAGLAAAAAAVAAAVAALVVTILLAKGDPEPTPEPPSDPPGSAVPAPPPINLLKFVDLAKSSTGEWRLEDGALISGVGGHTNLPHKVGIQFPFPEEYDLDIDAERVEGTETFLATFPAGGHPVCIVLDGWAGEACGVWDGSDWVQISGPVLAGGRKEIRFSVRRDLLEVRVNERLILRRTDLDRLGAPPHTHLKTDLAVGAIRSAIRITRIRVTPISQ